MHWVGAKAAARRPPAARCRRIPSVVVGMNEYDQPVGIGSLITADTTVPTVSQPPQPKSGDGTIPTDLRRDRASALFADRAPVHRFALGAGTGVGTPFLDRDETWLHKVRAVEEPRHLLAGAECVLLQARAPGAVHQFLPRLR